MGNSMRALFTRIDTHNLNAKNQTKPKPQLLSNHSLTSFVLSSFPSTVLCFPPCYLFHDIYCVLSCQNLLSWLKKQRDDGYTIVGLEQTSSSVTVAEAKFPPKTVLLLGKEREGIPVQFLQFVDLCVEIPQLGIIRSLNVHVSGAITIWEYTKQLQG